MFLTRFVRFTHLVTNEAKQFSSCILSYSPSTRVFRWMNDVIGCDLGISYRLEEIETFIHIVKPKFVELWKQTGAVVYHLWLRSWQTLSRGPNYRRTKRTREQRRAVHALAARHDLNVPFTHRALQNDWTSYASSYCIMVRVTAGMYVRDKEMCINNIQNHYQLEPRGLP